jgi:hypothetical protein
MERRSAPAAFHATMTKSASIFGTAFELRRLSVIIVTEEQTMRNLFANIVEFGLLGLVIVSAMLLVTPAV